MRRSFWSRLFAGWLACWLPLVLADAGGLHACPMHDGAQAAMVAAATAMPAMPGMAHDAAAYHGHRHGGHPAGHACTCLGACCAAVAVVPQRPTPLTIAWTERTPTAHTGRPLHEYVAAWTDFVLPFSTAPPRPASA